MAAESLCTVWIALQLFLDASQLSVRLSGEDVEGWCQAGLFVMIAMKTAFESLLGNGLADR